MGSVLNSARSPRSAAIRTGARKVFSFPVFLGGLLVVGVFVSARLHLPDPDTWWHLTVGEQILATGHWPTADSYSFTVSGNHWIAYEWLGEVVMALAARGGGLPGLTALLLGVSITLLLLLYYYAYQRSRNVKAAFVACALLLPATSVFFTLRPQLLGYGFLLFTLIWLERYRLGRSHTLWILPALFLLWVNTHGTFALGLMALGLYWASGLVRFRWGGLVGERWTPSQRRHLALVGLLSVLALMVTPYGTRLAAYPFEMALFQPLNIASILEWQPLSFNLWLGKLFLGLLLLFFLAQLVSRQSYRLEEIALLLFAVYAACVHIRFVLFFALVFTPLLAVLLSRWIPPYQPAKDRPVLNATLLALAVGGLIAFFPSQQEIERVLAETYPGKAVAYLRTHPVEGPVFNEYGWGGYLIWSLNTEHKVFIDGRADLYEYGGVLADYLRITGLDPNTLLLLRKYGVEACLLERRAPLGTYLAALPDWERVYMDDLSTVFVHKRGHPPAFEPVEAESLGRASRRGLQASRHEMGQRTPPAVQKR